jgi:pimeloyl-ACP methyl ester carboxylesterase
VAAAFGALVGGGVERRELDRGGRALRWLEAGEGAPTVVLEAGAMSPVAGFAAIFNALAPDHRVIAYDRAGYGAGDAGTFSTLLQADYDAETHEPTDVRLVTPVYRHDAKD